jgi:hypothetical protein
MIGRAFPKAAKLLLAVVLAQAFVVMAQEEQYPEGTEGGHKLAAELRNMRPENAQWKGDLKIQAHGPNGRTTTIIPASGQAITGDTEWRVIYTAGPTNGVAAEKLTVIHALDGTNRYEYARAPGPTAPLGEPRSLAGADADIPLAGSDFWLSDLGFEFYHWPDQRLLKPQMRRGRPCYVLDSGNPNARPGGYSKVVSFIDRETGGPIQAEAYGADGKLLKEFALGKFRKVNGKWELKRMEIDNDRTNSRTLLEFDLEDKPAAK